MKGGRTGAMLDPRRVVAPIRTLRKAKWILDLQPPDNEVSPAAKLYREFATGLASAAEAERTIRSRWIADMEAAFGVGGTRASIVNALDSARLAALNAAVATQNLSSPLGEALEKFKITQYDATVVAARELAQSDTALAALPNYGRGYRNAVEAGSSLRSAAEKFLDAVDRNLEAFGNDQSTSTSDVEEIMKSIDQSLSDIAADLKALRQGQEAVHAS